MRRLFLSLVSITIVSLSLSAKTTPDFTIEVANDDYDYNFKLKSTLVEIMILLLHSIIDLVIKLFFKYNTLTA